LERWYPYDDVYSIAFPIEIISLLDRIANPGRLITKHEDMCSFHIRLVLVCKPKDRLKAAIRG